MKESSSRQYEQEEWLQQEKQYLFSHLIGFKTELKNCEPNLYGKTQETLTLNIKYFKKWRHCKEVCLWLNIKPLVKDVLV